MSVQSADFGVNVNELLADKVVHCAARQLEALLTQRRCHLVDTTAYELARARFAAWARHPKRARAFLVMERNPDAWISSTDLARAVKYTGREWIRSMTTELRKWQVVAYDDAGQRVLLRPFKKGRELWSCRRRKRPDGTLITGGVRMTLLYRKAPTYGDAKDITHAEQPNLLSTQELLDGCAAVVEADVAVTEDERAAFRRELAAVGERAEARVRGPQLALPGTGTDGE